MARAFALALLLAAAGGWFGFVTPAGRERDRARDEYARARREREHLRSLLVSRRTKAAPEAPGDAAAAGRALRLALLRATEGLRVSGVEIAASGEARGARGRLSAEGEMVVLLRVAERLVAAGVRIDSVVLAPTAGAPAEPVGAPMQLVLDVGAGT